MIRMIFHVLSLGLAPSLALAPAASATPQPPHTFVLTYRAFGPVQSTGVYRPADGYEVRPEGCYAKHSEEAICGFTLKALRPITITNLDNAAHGAAADGSPIRTCCMFVQGDDRGYPISTAKDAPGGIAVLDRRLSAGEQIGLMLRLPNYRKLEPLAAITFSHGQGDRGVTFPEHVTELP